MQATIQGNCDISLTAYSDNSPISIKANNPFTSYLGDSIEKALASTNGKDAVLTASSAGTYDSLYEASKNSTKANETLRAVFESGTDKDSGSKSDGKTFNGTCPMVTDLWKLGEIVQYVSGSTGTAGAQIKFSKDYNAEQWVKQLDLNGKQVRFIKAGQTGTVWAYPSCEPLKGGVKNPNFTPQQQATPAKAMTNSGSAFCQNKAADIIDDGKIEDCGPGSYIIVDPWTTGTSNFHVGYRNTQSSVSGVWSVLNANGWNAGSVWFVPAK
jgi:hypothetical protein